MYDIYTLMMIYEQSKEESRIKKKLKKDTFKI